MARDGSESVVGTLRRTRSERTALAAFNITGFDPMLALAHAAAACQRPAIAQVSQSVIKGYGCELFKRWFELVKDLTGATLFLHLDHCADPALIADCVDHGWDSVMFDGSDRPIAENTALTHEVVAHAHARSVAVEAELGRVVGVEDGAVGGMAGDVACVAEIPDFVKKTQVDFLAVGFGNAHGHYQDTSGLHWDVLAKAASVTEIPLVLHGGTGLSDDEFRKAISLGCAKVNISTALKDQYARIVADPDVLEAMKKSPAALHRALQEKCRNVCEIYIRRFSAQSERTE